MSRLRRLENTEKIFYITYCLNRGQESFIEPGYQLLAQSIATARERRDFRLSAFVFMPDYWHALIRPRPGDSIGRILQTIKVTFTFRQKRSIDLTLRRLKLGWQPRFWDSFIRSVGVFHAKADYIHQKPSPPRACQASREVAMVQYPFLRSGGTGSLICGSRSTPS